MEISGERPIVPQIQITPADTGKVKDEIVDLKAKVDKLEAKNDLLQPTGARQKAKTIFLLNRSISKLETKQMKKQMMEKVVEDLVRQLSSIPESEFVETEDLDEGALELLADYDDDDINDLLEEIELESAGVANATVEQAPAEATPAGLPEPKGLGAPPAPPEELGPPPTELGALPAPPVEETAGGRVSEEELASLGDTLRGIKEGKFDNLEKAETKPTSEKMSTRQRLNKGAGKVGKFIRNTFLLTQGEVGYRKAQMKKGFGKLKRALSKAASKAKSEKSVKSEKAKIKAIETPEIRTVEPLTTEEKGGEYARKIVKSPSQLENLIQTIKESKKEHDYWVKINDGFKEIYSNYENKTKSWAGEAGDKENLDKFAEVLKEKIEGPKPKP